MRGALRKMGNSTGLIIPKPLLNEMGLSAGAKLDMRIEDGKLVAKPVSQVREGWAEDADEIAAGAPTEEERAWLDLASDGDADLKW